MKKHISFVFLVVLFVTANAQNNFNKSSQIFSSLAQSKLYSDSNRHSSMVDFNHLFWDSHLISPPEKQWQFEPIYLIGGGFQKNTNRSYAHSALGLQGHWQSGSGKFDFFGETNAMLSLSNYYIENYTDSVGVLPNGNLASALFLKPIVSLSSSAYLQYKATEHLKLQTGIGHHFFGDGYRSLLVADNTNSYPFAAIDVAVWKLRYNYTISHMMGHNSDFEPDAWKSKFTVFHYLDFNVTENFSIGLFEAVIQAPTDSVGVRNLDVNYLNPFIFFRPVEFSLGSPDNVFVGFNLSWHIAASVVLYGQLAVDEFILSEIKAQNGWWGNKQALQAGMKLLAPFGAEGLYLQGEANVIRPFIYSHENTITAYSHRNTSLAHPLGSNLIELIGIVSYEKSNWRFQTQLFAQRYGNDTTSATSVGRDINRPYSWRTDDYGHTIAQGNQQTVLGANLKLSYKLRRRFPMYIVANALAYQQNSRVHVNFSLGLSSGIFPMKNYQY